MKNSGIKTMVSLMAVLVSLFLSSAAFAGVRTIVKVDEIKVDVALGNAPSLPYQVWVTYSDGTSEFRQVRWTNSSTATEETEASKDASINKVGSEYTVKGFITGDNTTTNGYPVVATVTVTAKPAAIPSNKPVAEPLPLNKVRLTGNNRLTSNRDLDVAEMLQWPVAQQLYNYRDTYGLSTEGYPKSNGWDSPTTKLKGHGSGHYMSALAFAYAGCQDPAVKAQLLANIRRMVTELREMQEMTFVWDDKLGRYWEARDYAPEEELMQMNGKWSDFDNYKKDVKKYGYGYINAIPAAHCVLIEKYAPYNNESWVWAPYYSVHKQLAGLIDIANYVEDKEIAAKALLIAKDMGLWVWNRMHYRTYVKMDGDQAERRAKPGNRYEMWNMYIAGEVGGMCESLSRLSEMVSNPVEKERLLEAANCFDSPAFFDPLSRNVDEIRTRHANQHIPMIIGALRSYRGNNDPYYYNVAYNFWNFIQGRYRYAMGGVGIGEMFRQPYSQITGMTTASNINRRTGNPFPMTEMNETCCAYNLAKLSKDLNCMDPDDARYMDYYERVLYNQIVGSVDAHHYSVTYQYSVGLNSSKPFGSETPQSTCCGGTGAENHVKYQEAAYFVNDDTMWIALYMPTEADWDAKGVTVKQDCLWPAEKSTITVSGKKAKFALKLRVPYWATSGFDIKLNGKSVASSYQPCSYVEIPARKWSSKDVLEVVMPFSKHLDFGPDKMDTAVSIEKGKHSVEPMWVGAFMYGPLVMATTGISEWDQATVSLQSDLSEVSLKGASANQGVDGNVYKMSMGGYEFIPDYYAEEKATRYFRINLLGDPSAENKNLILNELSKVKSVHAENYSAASYAALASEIAKAEALYSAQTVSAAQANAEVAALEAAAKALVSAGAANKENLTRAINIAKNINEAVFTTESVASLKNVIAQAEKVAAAGSSQVDVDFQTYALRSAIDDLVDATAVDKSSLRDMMSLARSRRDAQTRWKEMETKVPDYAPWAPYGYARLLTKYDEANEVMNGNGRNYSQAEVDKMTSELNQVINNMRPGNLPEIEDLAELNALTAAVKESGKTDAATTSALDYAQMVISYVTDGSGTSDMIERAVSQLKALK